MPAANLFGNRRLKIAYWDSDSKFANSEKMHLEKSLKLLADLTVSDVKTLENLPELDLLVIAAHKVDEQRFLEWLRKICVHMDRPDRIWVPALVIANISFANLAPAIAEFSAKNWYFDVASPQELDSLPIRVANLLRIHDHLRELRRYDLELRQLDERVKLLETKVD